MRIAVNSTEDLLALVVRRKWCIAALFVALTCLVAIFTYVLPRTYVSEVLILVRPRDVPQEFVKDLIAGTPEERLKSIEQTLLSRTNLVQVLREFGDRLPEYAGLNMDEQVVKLRAQINISFELEKNNGKTLPLTYFRISYQNQNPGLAQEIASKLTSLFIDQDNRSRENQVFGTTEFLSSELNKVSEQLSQSQERLKQIKSTRLFELPDQRDANLKTLDRLALDKKSNAEALDRYAAILLTIESQLSQTPETVTRPVPPSASAAKDPQVAEYRKAQLAYDELSTKYKEKHPELQALKAVVERLRKQIPPELLSTEIADGATPASVNETAEVTTEPNPVYKKLSAQQEELKTEIEIRQKEKEWIESEIARYSRRVENAPNAEQDIVEAAQQNDDLKRQYAALKNDLTQAHLAESLESKQKGSQFVVVDPPNYPLSPSKPEKGSVLLAGAIISLLISVGVAIAFDVARQQVWTQSQIQALWSLRVLAEIPAVTTDLDLAVRRRKLFLNLGCSLAGVIAWSFCLYVVYLKHALILQQLDPLIQKVIYK